MPTGAESILILVCLCLLWSALWTRVFSRQQDSRLHLRIGIGVFFVILSITAVKHVSDLVFLSLVLVASSYAVVKHIRFFSTKRESETLQSIRMKSTWFVLLCFFIFLTTPEHPVWAMVHHNKIIMLYILLGSVALYVLWLLFLRCGPGRLYMHAYIQSTVPVYISCFISSFTEEFVFRGVIQGSLAQAYPIGIAVIIQGFLFAATHIRLGAPSGYKGFIYSGFLGLLLGIVVAHTGTFIYGVFLHAIIPIGRGITDWLKSYLKGDMKDLKVFYACYCDSKACLCQDHGRLRIRLSQVAGKLLEEISRNPNLTGKELVEAAGLSIDNRKVIYGLNELAELQKEGIQITFSRTADEVGCSRWKWID